MVESPSDNGGGWPREEALVRNLPSFRWDSREAVRYEVAIEALNRALGACTARIDAEQAAPHPDEGLLQRLREQMITCAALRGELDPRDHAAVDRVIGDYFALADELSPHPR
ncbi:MAG: hypothetical protein ACRDSH_21390 [Pseudonocardiaceae bacterium]